MDHTALNFYMQNHPWKEMLRKKADDATYILTGPVRIRWCSLAKARSMRRKGEPQKMAPDGTPIPDKLVYDATFIVPEQANVDPLRAVVVRLMSERFGPNFAAELVKPVSLPNGETIMVSSTTGGVKKQAEMFAKQEAGFSANGVYFSASTGVDYPPAIIGGTKDAFGNWITLDSAGADVYAGMWCLAYCKVYARPKQGTQNPGISFQLESIQKIADDTRFETKGKTHAFDEIQPHAAPGGAVNGTGAAPAKAPAPPAGF